MSQSINQSQMDQSTKLNPQGGSLSQTHPIISINADQSKPSSLSKSEIQSISSARSDQQAQQYPANTNQNQTNKYTIPSKMNTPAKTDRRGDQLQKKSFEEEMAEVDNELK